MRTAARAWTSCCNRRSATPRMAGRCIPRSPGTGSGWSRNCARTARTSSCRAAWRRRRATCSPSRRWPRRCARSRGTAPRRSTKARSPPTSSPPCAPAAGCTPRRISPPGLHTAEFVDADPARTGAAMTCSSARRTARACVGLMILGMLGGLPTAPDGPLGTLRAHRHIEAARLAYRDRDAFVADPCAGRGSGQETAQPGLPGGAARADRRHGKAMRDLPAAGEALLPPHRDTVYLCVVDKDGNACSFINSLFEGFGSRHPGGTLRRHAAEPRLRLPPGARPSELHRAAQAADAHDHSGHADARTARR